MAAITQSRTPVDVAPVAVAVAVMVQLLAVRLAFWSDGEQVLFLGIPIGAECVFRTHFGIPCPACGLTRSVALALQGQLSQAMDLNPFGPFGILGLVLLSVALLWLARARGAAAASRVRKASLAYAGIGAGFWILWWLQRVLTVV